MLTFDSLEDLLLAHSTNKIIPGLERISRLLERLGNPQDSFKAVHIVGTNGKGSTGAFISSVMTASGYRTAFYSSPHLESPGERLLIDGKPLTPHEWINATEQAVSVIRDGEELPSYFELLTAAAFVLMREHRVEVGVIEAGLGGRLDATNTMRNVVCSVIASISIDHTEYLGPTLEDIAAEKFAVIRPNTPAVFSGNPSENRPNWSLVSMFREFCRECGALPFVVSEEARVQNVRVSPEGNTLDFAALGLELESVRTGLIGRYQVDNAALALSALSIVRRELQNITEKAIRDGMSNASWPGRLEIVSRDPVVILDGGHNVDGVKRMCESLRELWPDKNIAVVYAAMRDKDYSECLGLLSELLQPKLYVTTVPGMSRAASVEELAAEALRYQWRSEVREYASPEEAVSAAKNSDCDGESPSRVVVVCGSLYLVGYVRSKIGNQTNR